MGYWLMRILWTKASLTRRIDRCYLVAAWTKATEKRMLYLDLARHYRGLLSAMEEPALAVRSTAC